jgi:hypothetical protein
MNGREKYLKGTSRRASNIQTVSCRLKEQKKSLRRRRKGRRRKEDDI